MGATLDDGVCSMFSVHLRRTFSDSNRARPRDISSGGKIRHMDASAAVCVRAEFSGGEVPADAEQGDRDRGDIGGGHGGAPAAELVTDYEGGVGSGGCGGGAEWVVVVHSGGSVGVCAEWPVWGGVEGVFMGSFWQSLGILSSISCLCCHVVVSLT